MPRWIIPARAGFTAHHPVLYWSLTDHPRSRGVYSIVSPKSSMPRWIIPARAGFTAHHPVLYWSLTDHPRSRGVYSILQATDKPIEGSSPLARGLRDHPGGPACRRRIIPARAGFTLISAAIPMCPPDHPRSRGVYLRRRPATSLRSGSSPLARGLLKATPGDVLEIRIIPARAGFTIVRRLSGQYA